MFGVVRTLSYSLSLSLFGRVNIGSAVGRETWRRRAAGREQRPSNDPAPRSKPNAPQPGRRVDEKTGLELELELDHTLQTASNLTHEIWPIAWNLPVLAIHYDCCALSTPPNVSAAVIFPCQLECSV